MLAALLVLVFAAGQWIVPRLPGLVGYGTPMDQVVNQGVPPPEQPFGLAFAIWILIFTLSTLYGLRQVLPGQRDTVVYQSIRASALVAFAGSCAWMMVAQFMGNGPVLVAVIWVMLVAATRALFKLLAMRPTLDRFDGIVTLPLFAMLSAWLAAASVLNTVGWLKLIKMVPPTASPSVVAAATLLSIAVVSLVLLRRSGSSLWFGATTLWALGNVAYANLALRPNREIATITIGLMLVVVAAMIWQRRPVRQTDRVTR